MQEYDFDRYGTINFEDISNRNAFFEDRYIKIFRTFYMEARFCQEENDLEQINLI